jgi:hypothetical protein
MPDNDIKPKPKGVTHNDDWPSLLRGM